MKVRTHTEPEYSPTSIGLIRIVFGVVCLSVAFGLAYLFPTHIDFSCDRNVGICELHQKGILRSCNRTITISEIITAKIKIGGGGAHSTPGELIVLQTDHEIIPLSEFQNNTFGLIMNAHHIISRINRFLKHHDMQKLHIIIKRTWLVYIFVLPLFTIGIISVLGGIWKLFKG